MKDSYSGNAEVAAVRAQLAAAGQSSPDLAAQAKELDTKLAAFGGAVEGRGGRGGGRGGAAAPGAMQSFIALNNAFNTMVSMVQVGLDMAPTQAQIDTWQNDCTNYNTTVAAWKKAQAEELTAFNAAASKAGQRPLTITPTKLTPAVCTFAPAAAPATRR
jgi:hypothetical protein